MITCSEVQNMYHTLSHSIKQIYFTELFVISHTEYMFVISPNHIWVFHIY